MESKRLIKFAKIYHNMPLWVLEQLDNILHGEFDRLDWIAIQCMQKFGGYSDELDRQIANAMGVMADNMKSKVKD